MAKSPQTPLNAAQIKSTFEMIRQYNDQMLVIEDDPSSPTGVKWYWRPLKANEAPLQRLRDNAAKCKSKYFNCRHQVTWEDYDKLAAALETMLDNFIAEQVKAHKAAKLMEW